MKFKKIMTLVLCCITLSMTFIFSSCQKKEYKEYDDSSYDNSENTKTTEMIIGGGSHHIPLIGRVVDFKDSNTVLIKICENFNGDNENKNELHFYQGNMMYIHYDKYERNNIYDDEPDSFSKVKLDIGSYVKASIFKDNYDQVTRLGNYDCLNVETLYEWEPFHNSDDTSSEAHPVNLIPVNIEGKVLKIKDDNTVLIKLTKDFYTETPVKYKKGDKIYVHFEFNFGSIHKELAVGDKIRTDTQLNVEKPHIEKTDNRDCFFTKSINLCMN